MGVMYLHCKPSCPNFPEAGPGHTLYSPSLSRSLPSQDHAAQSATTRGRSGAPAVGLRPRRGAKGRLRGGVGALEVEEGSRCLQRPRREQLCCPPRWPLEPPPHTARQYVNTALPVLLARTIFALGIWVGRHGDRHPQDRKRPRSANCISLISLGVCLWGSLIVSSVWTLSLPVPLSGYCQ